MTLKERFETKYIPEPNSGCWLWVGALSRRGYGKISITRSQHRLAHRISWQIHKGEIPAGMLVCHTCDMPCCVNPDHLWLGSHKQNTQDALVKGRLYSEGCPGIKNGRAILSEQEVLEIRIASTPAKILAKRYGVHWATVYKIRQGRLWGHAYQEANHRAGSRL